MKIIILGAGQVGGTLAEHLAIEQNDITVVDTDGDKLRALQDRSSGSMRSLLVRPEGFSRSFSVFEPMISRSC